MDHDGHVDELKFFSTTGGHITPPDIKHFLFVLQHTQPGSGANFLLSGMASSNGPAVSLLS